MEGFSHLPLFINIHFTIKPAAHRSSSGSHLTALPSLLFWQRRQPFAVPLGLVFLSSGCLQKKKVSLLLFVHGFMFMGIGSDFPILDRPNFTPLILPNKIICFLGWICICVLLYQLLVESNRELFVQNCNVLEFWYPFESWLETLKKYLQLYVCFRCSYLNEAYVSNDA